jgi:hypothetical protein
VSHFFQSRWGDKTTCQLCGGKRDSAEHMAAYAVEAGFDVTVCPGCELPMPTDLTVRMMRWVSPAMEEHRNVRVCRNCAGFKEPRAVLLAQLHDRNLLSDEEYAERLMETFE